MVVKKDMEMKKVKESMPSKRIHAANPNQSVEDPQLIPKKFGLSFFFLRGLDKA